MLYPGVGYSTLETLLAYTPKKTKVPGFARLEGFVWSAGLCGFRCAIAQAVGDSDDTDKQWTDGDPGGLVEVQRQ